MTTVPLQQAQAELVTLIHGLGPGDELVITEGDKPVARIIPSITKPSARKLGSMSGTVLHMDDDFDAPLEDFLEYSS